MVSSLIGRRLACQAAAVLCMAILSPQGAFAAPASRDLPKPTGHFAVGRMTFFWTDASRPETFTDDEADHRQLRVDVWYPAEPRVGETPGPYFPDLGVLGKRIGTEAILLNPIKGHTFQAPPIAAGNARYPVLVFSPGYGTNAVQYTCLVEELVSHGYLVATVDHPFQSRAIAYLDGRIVTTAPDTAASADPQAREKDYQARMDVLAADLRFVLDSLTRLNEGDPEKQFAGRMDLDRVGVLGHSIGGSTASEAALSDPRFKAVANLDGHHLGLAVALDAEGRAPKQPFAELTDGDTVPSEKQLATWKLSRAEFDQQMAKSKRRANDSLASVVGGSFRITIPGVRHNSFGDMAIWDPDSLEVRYRRMQMIRDYTLAFLDKSLRGNPQTLLDQTSGPYAEVTIERFPPRR